MRIFHVITLADLGGAQAVLINLVRKACEDGHEVYVISEEEGPMWQMLPCEVTRIKINKLVRKVDLVKDLQVLVMLIKYYKRYKPDVIHLHSSKIGILGRIVFPPSKILYTVHGFDSIRLAYRRFLPIEKLLKRRAFGIIAVSRYDLNNLKKEGITGNVSFIYNGIYDPVMEEVREPAALKRLRDLKAKGKFIVLTIARLSPPKRFDIFLETAQQLENEDVIFVWIGNQRNIDRLPGNVICLGEIPHASAALANASVFFLPSDFEGLPVSILEAMAFGVPALASKVGGIGEIIDGRNGFALPNEASCFAEKILEFRNSAEIYGKACNASRGLYLEHFTIEKMYNQYLALYKKIWNKK